MHPRNYYKENKPDFGKLAQARPSLKPFLLPSPSATHAYTLDFSNPEALRELTCALLECDFGLRVELPVGKLVPTLTLRLNYIHWVEDLLSANGNIPQGDSVLGIDIGTGASCVYPLLGTKLNGWRFLATEIDKDSVACALNNVQRNAMDDKIKIVQVPEDTLLLGSLDDHQQYHFCMCNPPFFKDGEERYGGVARSGNRPVPSTVNTGGVSETITSGGEVEFVQRIIRDSLQLGTKIKWYTSMLGKKSSLSPLKAELKKLEVPVVTTTEFVQGRTRRWGIAWCFDQSLQPKQDTGQRARKRPHPQEMTLSNFPSTCEGISLVADWVKTKFKELQIEYITVLQSSSCVELRCNATMNTWLNQRRKRRLLQQLETLQLPNTGLYPPCPSEDVQQDESSVPGNDAQDSCAQKQKIMDDLNSLSTPCHAVFIWSIVLEETAAIPTSKEVTCPGTSPLGVVMRGEWLEGDNKDIIHQIMQYLSNNLGTQ